MSNHYRIRSVDADDVPRLREIYRSAARHAGAHLYSTVQTDAWESFADELQSFETFVLTPYSLVAEQATVDAFGGLDDTGYIRSLYVSPNVQRQGLGSRLLERLIEHGVRNKMPRLFSATNPISKSLLEKFGFVHYDTEIVERGPATFERYLMELILKDKSL